MQNMLDSKERCFVLSAPFVMEFIGTFFLIFTITLTSTVGYDNPVPGLAIGGVLVVLVNLAGPVSGAHFNPAVSFGIFLSRRNKITLRKVLGYILVQVFAGFIASGLVAGISHGAHIEPPNLSDTYNFMRAFIVEALFTFLLMSVVLNVGSTKGAAENKPIIAMSVGFTIMTGALSVGHISGAVFNPAVGTGPFIVGFFIPKENGWLSGGDLIEYILLLYWLAPILGSSLAALIFRITVPDEYSSTSYDHVN